MDIGLGNLTMLKTQLLPEAERNSESYDTLVVNIGRGVAKAIESYCGRKFPRLVGSQDEFGADHRNVWLTRPPVEAVTKIELRETVSDGWVDQPLATTIVNQDKDGWIYFGGELGNWYGKIRITYTGGYWFDSTEDGSGVIPDGATALPDDLKLAWLMQCSAVWSMQDKLGRSLTDKPNAALLEVIERGAKLTGQVTELLQPYRRLAAI